MPTLLRYGATQTVELNSIGAGSLVQCGAPRGAALDDVEGAVREALAAPIEYPPLAQATTPDDQIVLALEAGVPQAAAIVKAVIAYLSDSGVGLDGITLLCTQADGPSAAEPVSPLCRDWPDAWKQHVKLMVHDPADAKHLAHLARDTEGEPIFLHRALTDADVVLPIGLLCDEQAPGYYGVHTGLFPGFSNRKAREPFCTSEAFEGPGKHHSRLLAEVNHVAWLLGAMFTIQVVPGGGDRVLRVLAGESAAVAAAGRKAYQAAWHARIAAPAGLVVAGIEGSASQQTWLTFGRALEAALPLVDSGGALILCCELAAQLGPALQSLCDAPAPQEAVRRMAKRRFEDFLPAIELARALESNRVYLLSGLDPAAVEQLGMIPLAGTDELLRLMGRHDGCIVLSNAPHARIRFAEEQ